MTMPSGWAGGNSTVFSNAGTAKAWVNFNGTGVVAIRASFNVRSITDNGTGDYTVNFTTALVDTNYNITTDRAGNTTGNPGLSIYTTDDGGSGTAPTTSAIRLASIIVGSVFQDSSRISVTIFR